MKAAGLSLAAFLLAARSAGAQQTAMSATEGATCMVGRLRACDCAYGRHGRQRCVAQGALTGWSGCRCDVRAMGADAARTPPATDDSGGDEADPSRATARIARRSFELAALGGYLANASSPADDVSGGSLGARVTYVMDRPGFMVAASWLYGIGFSRETPAVGVIPTSSLIRGSSHLLLGEIGAAFGSGVEARVTAGVGGSFATVETVLRRGGAEVGRTSPGSEHFVLTGAAWIGGRADRVSFGVEGRVVTVMSASAQVVLGALATIGVAFE